MIYYSWFNLQTFLHTLVVSLVGLKMKTIFSKVLFVEFIKLKRIRLLRKLSQMKDLSCLEILVIKSEI